MKLTATRYAFTMAIPKAVIRVSHWISAIGPTKEIIKRTSRIAQILM